MTQLNISICRQSLDLTVDGSLIESFPISTAANGIGFSEGSFTTPIGNFYIAEKIGDNAPLGTVFKARKPIGIWDPESNAFPNEEDLILSRILWLQGTDEGNTNTKDRYIYIHGTNHEELIGTPVSCGCIRMKNADIISLYDQVEIGDYVGIWPLD